MSVLVDWQIRDRCDPLLAQGDRLLDPFSEAVSGNDVISYGLSHCGYDLRLAEEFVLFEADPYWGHQTVMDPKRFHDDVYKNRITRRCSQNFPFTIPPHHYALARTVEYVRMPNDLVGIVVGKSTYARSGILINCTPIEPSWCMSEDTEALTNSGWELLSSLKEGDSVLTRREDGNAEFQKVTRIITRQYEGDLFHFDGKSVDQLVTPDHRMFVWNPFISNGPLIKTAESIYGKWNYQFDRAVRWEGRDPPHPFVVGNRSYSVEDFAEFYGCWLGDGSAYYGNDGGYRIQLAVVTKEKKRNHFRSLLHRMGVKACEHERGFAWYDKDLCNYLMPHGHARFKYILSQWKEASPKVLLRLLAGLIASDGNEQTMTFTTTSKRLADDVQEVSFKAGMASIVRKVEGTLVPEAYKVRLCSSHMKPKMKPSNHKKVSYQGNVHCITVPNHVWLSRRNGKASWTGNCGHIVLEIGNCTPLPAVVYPNEGIAQLLFHRLHGIPEKTYADKGGKYQGQTGVTLAKV